ncbi:unnamed protein product, partial [Staurois parvus]
CLYHGRGRERAQAGAGVSKVSIIGVSGRNSAQSLCKVWWRGDYGVGLFFKGWTWPPSSSEGVSKVSIIGVSGRDSAPSFVS